MSTSPRRLGILGLALCAFVGLAGCDTANERAEKHYQAALALVAEGDVDRAIVEFKNVFELNGLHREARLAYAKLLREQGNYSGAFGHYLLLAEQYPNDPVPRKWLFRIAMLNNNFDAAEMHGRRAQELAPDDPESQAIGAILDYQKAVLDGDDTARQTAAENLQAIAKNVEDVQLYMPALVDNAVREKRYPQALEEIDKLLSADPKLPRWQELKLRILTELNDQPGMRAQLESMIAMFPGNRDYPKAMVQWHLARNDQAGAEAFLRGWAEDADSPSTKVERQLQLVGFLAQVRGVDAATAELERLAAANDKVIEFRAMRAGLLFDQGKRDEGIALMSAIIDGDKPDALGPDGDPSKLYDVEVTLARMLIAMGRQDEARARIANVLKADPNNVNALKQEAAWLIQDDKTDAAIVKLRAALAGQPDDPDTMAMLADAHMRNGSKQLAGEMLALADEASNNAPDRALAYARFLVDEKGYPAARDILVKALRETPGDPALLDLLGKVYVETSDWFRGDKVEKALRAVGTEDAVRRADALRVASLRAQKRGQEALRFLQDLADSDTSNEEAVVAVARLQMEFGKFADAEVFIKSRLEEFPDQPVLRMLLAALYAQTKRGAEAEEILRKLVEEDPKREIVWRTLYETKMQMGDTEEAGKILADALMALPDSPDLLWAQAGEREREGDLDGAIAIYESLYERLPYSTIVANNLASLLSTKRADPATLDRAYTIARRLRGSTVPAFQDTYGWIAHLRGETDDALTHLEAAAAALPNDPYVQYHLGMAYAAANRTEDAITHLKRAISLAGPESARAEFRTAEAEVERIETQQSGK